MLISNDLKNTLIELGGLSVLNDIEENGVSQSTYDNIRALSGDSPYMDTIVSKLQQEQLQQSKNEGATPILQRARELLLTGEQQKQQAWRGEPSNILEEARQMINNQ